MTATAQATPQSLAEWIKIFPRQITENLTSSAAFIKKLSVVTLSTITYLKNIFPHENFVCEELAGIKIITLKDKCDNELAQFLNTALKQALEAFEKKYLHKLVMCFYDGDSKLDNLLEYYMLEYTYKEDGVSMTIMSSKSHKVTTDVTCTLGSVREQTCDLLRTCLIMMQYSPQELPDTCDITLRLYYNEDAPAGYQAPGFVAAAACDDPVACTMDAALRLGGVRTPFHKLTLKSYIKESARASHEAIPSLNPPMMTQTADDISCTLNSTRTGDSASSERRLHCACNNFDGENTSTALLTCQYCNTQQHAICYGVRASEAARVRRHCCAPCAARDPGRVPTDRTLAGVTVRKGESIAIFRRALDWCSRATSVAAIDLCTSFGLTHVSACKLLKLLDYEGIIRHAPNSEITTPSKIVPAKLQSVLERYFKAPEGEGEGALARRLVAETLAAANRPDPVGDILSPVEKISLHNASQLGKIIDPEVNNNEKEDPTMKKYRDALIVLERVDNNPFLKGDPFENTEKPEKKTGKRIIGNVDKMKTGVKTKRVKKQI